MANGFISYFKETSLITILSSFTGPHFNKTAFQVKVIRCDQHLFLSYTFNHIFTSEQ